MLCAVILSTTLAQFAFFALYRANVVERGVAGLLLAQIEGVRATWQALPDTATRERMRENLAGSVRLERALPASAAATPPLWARPLAERLVAGAAPGLALAWERGTVPRLWAGWSMDEEPTWIGFDLAAPGPFRPIVVWLLLLAGIVATTSWAMAVLLGRPLRRLHAAIAQAGPNLELRDFARGLPTELAEIAASYDARGAALRRQQDERALMLAGLSHDLRAPLTRLRLRLDLVEGTETEPLLRDLGMLRRIVDRFLEVVRAGHPVRGRTPDAGRLVEELVTSWRTLGWDVTVQAVPGTAVPLPPDDLARVVTNLVENARAHGAEPITMGLTRDAAGVALRVTDHGAGIPPEHAAAATQPFARLDPARSLGGHAGLGLYVVRTLVEQSGGRLAFGHPTTCGFTVEAVWPSSVAGLSREGD